MMPCPRPRATRPLGSPSLLEDDPARERQLQPPGDQRAPADSALLQDGSGARWSGTPAWFCHLASPATRLIDVAMMTAPKGNDSHACRSAVRRICLDSMLVSDTWNVMPIVKGQVGEVAIVRGAGLVEVDPPGLPGVVQARVSEGEHRMDEGPGHEDGHQRETCLQVFQVPAGMTGSDQHEPHSDQAGDRRAEQYHVRQVEAGILALTTWCAVRVGASLPGVSA